MSISSAMNAGVSGLAANSSRLGTISDNIANASTFGYKRVETDFNALVVGQGAGLYTAGGVRASTTRSVSQDGAIVTTSNALDLAMTGRGMLPVTTLNDATGGGTPSLMMTRTGAFRPDAGGLLRTESGLVLMGWPTAADGSMPLVARDTSAALQPIRIESNRPVGDPTTQVSLGANLPATETLPTGSGDPLPLRVEYFGNLGTSESLDITFTPDTSDPTGMSNTWTVSISDSASDPAANPISTFQVTFDDSQGAGGALLNVVGGGYDPATGAIPLTVGGGNIELSIGVPGGASGLKQLAASFSPSNVVKNGSPVGQLVAVEVDPQGYVKATYDTGFVKALYKIPVIDVPNPNGLVAVEGQAFKTSPDSGGFFLWDAGDGPTGAIAGYAREASTTDIAQELTHLITTQRAYSSNAKIIQTVDEMLQETTNIKR
ncbi:flagellar hook protein FlgE [Paracoccus sp. S4493]|jgi:flagellar hook protein FlgE|uniref:flagellar hook protein FlgE n=1 Tax=Paracoccus TaxID=265 RepID=UPI0005FA72BB|nr:MULTISPECIES: flagellar hook-basal body complex protein [Paracoccus]AZY92836.1 flagellar hook-basal body complex protein [Paracoccus sp. Arc7-R13]KJZ32828.1 flagellar hook protein FlgE [Paracoccus sp. S4493]QXI65113.1 Flagellar hook protein FlgE [Paracoccus marcusii]TNC04351.1 flagellar hook-basal body complex protein [Paracoccus marcusii]|tara:strand:+ start:2968 stop:4266 length:1299 start_codon:yes stop_codon:yes gene_type:complete